MMTLFKLVVQQKMPPKLGAFLLKHGFSKQAINNAKHNQGLILVNHKRRYTSYQLHLGDEIIFVPGQEKRNVWLHTSNLPLAIVKETTNYLVINKPAGVLSIPSRFEDDSAVVNRVLGYFARKNQPDLKPHVVTRLDKDTSGLVLVGKNPIAHSRFSKISKTDFVKKYHAIVHGNFASDEAVGLIDAPIGRSSEAIERSVTTSGKKAQTQYQVLEQVDGASLVELRLLTGRTHQIRVHMQFLGHPLFGDQLYGIADGFQRQALNCYYLAFPDPFMQQQKIELKINDPLDMTNLWGKIKNSAS
ncbi:RluA family pseudouridine synthase [Lactobacillus sp. ESL0684]|uniref:RluA family pseudouridine synthase n=1 Tax=Lactobacillus sp. ESL0684 TaxID=2983213 RepID=UPI0023F646BD|nr:RluA family pseudouridine synthase [Lactobacillus sp. ESL0684]WEV44523.1 RluA family pseudouridine synthase [Lactobacillus sp. ESL0684]